MLGCLCLFVDTFECVCLDGVMQCGGSWLMCEFDIDR